MLNTQDIANLLSQKLNEIGAEKPDQYTFRLLAEIGALNGGADICGIVRSQPNEYVPVNGYVEVRYVYAVELLIPAQRANYNYINVCEIVGEAAQALQGTAVSLGGETAVLSFTLPAVGRYNVNYAVGESVPMSFTVRATYTNGTPSAEKHWSIDGLPIPFLSETVTLEQDGIQKKIFTGNFTDTILTGHTKYYTFRIPYESDVYKFLQSEIMQYPYAVHTLAYYDGAAFTQEKPFTSDVVIFRTAISKSEMPNGSAFEVTFTDAYDSDGNTLQYYLSLIDFPFDMGGEDTRYFASQSEQQEYFEYKAASGGAPFVLIDAPNLDNLVITRQVYKGAQSGMTQFDYAGKNYAVVKVVNGSDVRYFYYYVENCSIGAHGQVIVDLKMDTVQTYFFDPSVTFSDCMIERAHLNRFEDAGNGNVKFVSDPASKIFNSEEGLNFPKRMVKRTKLDLQFTGNAEVDAWLNENVAYWVYVFISPNHGYTVANIGAEGTTTTEDTIDDKSKYVDGRIMHGDGIAGAAYCFSYPVYSTTKLISVQTSVKNSNDWDIVNIQIRSSGGDGFEELNSGTSYYYVKKISILPPFRITSQGTSSMYVDEDGDLIIPARALTILDQPNGYNYIDGNRVARLLTSQNGNVPQGYGSPCVVSTDNSNATYPNGVFWGGNQAASAQSIKTGAYLLSQNRTYAKSDIAKNQVPDLKYNPKLNGQNFKELIITAADGGSFTYDIQKLVASSVVFEYSEPLIPEITRYYMRVQGDTGLYVDQTDENYMGLVGSSDNSLAFVNDVYDSFIANNKNFFMQSNLKIGANLVGGLLGAAGQAVSGAIAGAAGGPVGMIAGAVIGGVSGVVSSAVSAGISFIDRSMTVDNMKNAPDQMKNANGNVILNLFATELGLYVEEYSALYGDLKTANDFMDLYGFTFSAVANVKDYANIRKYHNFIKAQLQSINGNLSNTARNDLRTRFANGVRFWNSDTISYQYENYENWLDN